jgi:hypothetical protein
MMAGTTEGGSPAEAPQCPFLRGRSAAAMGDPFRQRGGLSQLQGDSVKTGLNPQKGNESPAVTALWKSCLEAQANHLGKPGEIFNCFSETLQRQGETSNRHEETSSDRRPCRDLSVPEIPSDQQDRTPGRHG